MSMPFPEHVGHKMSLLKSRSAVHPPCLKALKAVLRSELWSEFWLEAERVVLNLTISIDGRIRTPRGKSVVVK
jgi:hypothetical protein